MCRSKQASMLWFEMEKEALSKEGFTGPVWIQSSVDFIKRTINGTEEIGREKMELILNKWLADNSQLELRKCKECTPISVPGLPNICLWPSENKKHFNWQFICKNETFDEQGRMVVFQSNFIFCELEKITADLLRRYQPFGLMEGSSLTKDKTWTLRIIKWGNFARALSGWTVFDDNEESGIPLCDGSGIRSEANVVQHKQLTLYTSKAHALCIYSS